MAHVNTFKQFKEQTNHPYRSGEYFFDGTNIYEVSEDDNENQALIEDMFNTYGENTLFYAINWSDQNLFVILKKRVIFVSVLFNNIKNLYYDS